MFIFSKLFRKIFGSRNDRIIKSMRQKVAKINALEGDLQALSDAELADKTNEFKQRFEQGETLEQLLIEAFAVVYGFLLFGKRVV